MSVKFEDNFVRILDPNEPRGVLIYTRFQQPPDAPSLRETGLKTGSKMRQEGIEFGRTVYHDKIFFRAPFYANEIDYTSPMTEVKSLYGNISTHDKVFIRVDPENTFVFSSEIRGHYYPTIWTGESMYTSIEMENEVENSRKSMVQYFDVIADNARTKELSGDTYHLYSSQKCNWYSRSNPKYPYIQWPIHKSSEIYVKIPHLTSDYFVTIDN
jgi:hypothetical protein